MAGDLHAPTGHVFRVERARGPIWYAKYRLPDGRRALQGRGWKRPDARRCIKAGPTVCVAWPSPSMRLEAARFAHLREEVLLRGAGKAALHRHRLTASG
jgi:hypothetical protein